MNSYDPQNYNFLKSQNRDQQRNPYHLVSRPKSLDIDTMLPPSLRHRVDDALYVISVLVFKAAHGMVNANGYTNLNFDILAEIMNGRTQSRVKNSLIANEVIQCDGIWSPKVKSLGYRLHPRFRNDVAITSILKNRRICRALDRYYVKKLAESKALWLPVHHELNRRQHMIEIDMDQANEIIERLEPNVKGKPNAGKRGKYDPDIITRRTKLAQSSLCQSIHTKSNVLKVGTTGRVYNCATSLSRELRPAMRYEGEQLECVDIRNSQPALLRKLVEDHLESDCRENASHIGISGLYAGCGVRDSWDQDVLRLYALDQDTLCQGSLYGLRFQDDFILYSELTANGEFYNFMWEQVQLAGYRLPKDAVKAKFLTDIFAKKKVVQTKSGLIVPFDYDSVVEEVFRDLFPSVYRFICETNESNPANGVTLLNKHSVLIRRLQKTEAQLVIEGAAPLALAHPSQPLVLTCHDAFFCGAGESEILNECLMSAAASQGHRFETKIDYFR